MKNDFPEEGEIVLCTVKEIKKPQVFVNIDKYNKVGVIQFSEVSAGRIRNIREHVVPNKKIVCKVLRVIKERGHIDLSLRRVSSKERRKIMKEYALNKNAESLLKAILRDNFIKIRKKIIEGYGTFYNFIEEFMKNKRVVEKVGIDKKFVDEIEKEIKKRFKEKEFKNKYILSIYTTDSDGLNKIKKLVKSIEGDGVIVRYVSAPQYEVIIKGKDSNEIQKKYKKIEKSVLEQRRNFDNLSLTEA